jgi:flap endonuclease-1
MHMGVDISGILVKHQTSLKEQGGMTLSIDGYNILYQFLSSIRQPDGTPLMDSMGRVTSHLSGIFYRTINMIEAGIKPVYVFDGKPSELKNRTIEARVLMKEKAKLELEEARAAGNEERVRSLSARTSHLTREMVNEARTLLDYMGVPNLVAPSEGEAQASMMSKRGLVDGVVSQDYDCLMFGAKRVFRNFTYFGRRKVPGRNMYINVVPEYMDLGENLEKLQITHEQLIHIGILVGTDFNRGIYKVGAKTALNLIRKHGDIYGALKAKEASIDNLEQILDLFRNPPYDEGANVQMQKPEPSKIVDFLCSEHGFAFNRIENYIGTLQDLQHKQSQKSLDSFF